MHNDVVKVSNQEILKPEGKIHVVYFSPLSNTTHRFIKKLEVLNSRIPHDLEEEILVDKDYVLITPTYSEGGDIKEGAVPKQVIKFLNNKRNRNFCRGVIAWGNTNFGDTFAIAGPILSKKLNVPLLFQFELLGTHNDVSTIKKILVDFWDKDNKNNNEINTLSGTLETGEYVTLNARAKSSNNAQFDLHAAQSYMKNHIKPN